MKFLKGFFVVITLSFHSLSMAAGDQHSVEAISTALQMPIPAEVIEEAQKADDAIMKKGELEDTKVYLVTDARLSKIKGIANKILSTLDKDQQGWVVRVLDTKPQQVNAFVTGGKYIYIFTGLIEHAQSDDEIAFILSHEIGHSFLKQNIRKQNDSSQTMQDLLTIGAMLSDKHSEKLLGTAQIMAASYSQKDEEEADAIAVILAKRAGYDPIRGIDFFSRSKREEDENKQALNESIDKERSMIKAHQTECKKNVESYEKGTIARTTENAKIIHNYCTEIEKMRIAFNKKMEAHDAASQQELTAPFFNSHPVSQERIAAIAASVDFLDGARTVESLSEYEQTQRVYQALMATQSTLYTFKTGK